MLVTQFGFYNTQPTHLKPAKLMAIAAYVLDHACAIDPESVTESHTPADIQEMMLVQGREHNSSAYSGSVAGKEGWLEIPDDTLEDMYYMHTTATDRYRFCIGTDIATVRIFAGDGKEVFCLQIERADDSTQDWIMSWWMMASAKDRPDRFILLMEIFGSHWPIALQWLVDAYQSHNKHYYEYTREIETAEKAARDAHLVAHRDFLASHRDFLGDIE